MAWRTENLMINIPNLQFVHHKHRSDEMPHWIDGAGVKMILLELWYSSGPNEKTEEMEKKQWMSVRVFYLNAWLRHFY